MPFCATCGRNPAQSIVKNIRCMIVQGSRLKSILSRGLTEQQRARILDSVDFGSLRAPVLPCGDCFAACLLPSTRGQEHEAADSCSEGTSRSPLIHQLDISYPPLGDWCTDVPLRTCHGDGAGWAETQCACNPQDAVLGSRGKCHYALQ